MSQTYRVNPQGVATPTGRWSPETNTSSGMFDVPLPKIRRGESVAALGSCFASHIVTRLRQEGCNVNGDAAFFFYDDSLTTPRSVREHFEWLTRPDLDVPHDKLHPGDSRKSGNVSADDREKVRSAGYEAVARSKMVVITLGLIEIWVGAVSGRSVWKRPRDLSEQHVFHVMTVQEIVSDIRSTVDMIRSINRDTQIVFTVSPVPLEATFRDLPIAVANMDSKSRLRAGLGEVLEGGSAGVFYWPSYEWITMLREDVYDPDGRHIRLDRVARVLDEFCRRTLT
jgi:hypothetical protein